MAQYGPPPTTLLSETGVAAKLGYPLYWIIWLRKKGITTPIKPWGYWRYSEEQVRQIPALIAETKKCQRCGKPRPFDSHSRFCKECQHYRKKHRYEFQSPEATARHREKCRLYYYRHRVRVRPTAATWQAVLEKAGYCCAWSEGGEICGLLDGDRDPIGGGTVRLTPDHKQPHSINPVADPNDPEKWQPLCGRHQVVKKNYWDDETGWLNVYAIVQSASEAEKLRVYEFLRDYFGRQEKYWM